MRLTVRTPSARLLGTAMVGGYGLHFHKRSVDGSAKCSIATQGSGVRVAVYELSLPDKSVLDRVEGVGQGYTERVINVPGFDDCVTYIAEASYVDSSIQPYDWYHELVLMGCRFHGFPDEYVSNVLATRAVTDPDVERRAMNRALIDKIRLTVF